MATISVYVVTVHFIMYLSLFAFCYYAFLVTIGSQLNEDYFSVHCTLHLYYMFVFLLSDAFLIRYSIRPQMANYYCVCYHMHF